MPVPGVTASRADDTASSGPSTVNSPIPGNTPTAGARPAFRSRLLYGSSSDTGSDDSGNESESEEDSDSDSDDNVPGVGFGGSRLARGLFAMRGGADSSDEDEDEDDDEMSDDDSDVSGSDEEVHRKSGGGGGAGALQLDQLDQDELKLHLVLGQLLRMAAAGGLLGLAQMHWKCTTAIALASSWLPAGGSNDNAVACHCSGLCIE